MATCSRCGEWIEFRYIDDRCIPLHLNGSCSGSYSQVREFAGSRRNEESSCFTTTCPECGDEVYFIRHNGGSVWIDPPLGYPWDKHPCMDKGRDSASTKSASSAKTLALEFKLKRNANFSELTLGVVKETNTIFSKKCSVITIETGKKAQTILLMRGNAGFLLGRLVIHNPESKLISWIEDEKYSFRILGIIDPPGLLDQIECPECGKPIEAGAIWQHLKSQHYLGLF